MSTLVLVFGLLLTLGGVGYFIYLLKRFFKDPLTNELDRQSLLRLALSVGALSLGTLLLTLSLFLFHPDWAEITSYSEHLFQGERIVYASQLSFALIGSFLFALCFATLWGSFALYFYKPKLKAPQKDFFHRLLYFSIPFALLFFLMGSEGIAPYLSYPLVSGFGFNSTGFVWTTSANSFSFNGLHIAFYGIIMLFGVAVAYWICDHRFYREFHKHGLLDSLVLVVFPAGVIGARIWYVVGNYQREFASRVANGDWTSVFRIWDGGITILGGAFAGILAGIIFLKVARKYVNIRWAIDVCVPTILLAQAIGRWGNFFNSEVYGFTVDYHAGWSWLPNWLLLQMNTNNGGGYLDPNLIHVPLFLVESLLNIAGYFLLAYGVRKGLAKYVVKGDLLGCYFLWYGVVRLIMEPMRDASFNMGTDNAWSVANSLVYIVLGFASILYLHLHDYFLQKENKAYLGGFIAALLCAIALAFPALPSLSVSTGSNTFLASYQGFALLFSGKAPLLLSAYVFVIVAVVGFLVEGALSYLQQENFARIARLIALAFALVGALIFLFGKDGTLLGNTFTAQDGTVYTSINYSLSYGFVLTAAFALWGAAIGGCQMVVLHEKKTQAKHEEANA